MTQGADTRTPPYGSQVFPDEHETLPQDTGPQQRLAEEERVYELVEHHQMLQKDVAGYLNLSAATVSRRFQAAKERRAARKERQDQQQSSALLAVRVTLIACMILTTVAVWIIAIKVIRAG